MYPFHIVEASVIIRKLKLITFFISWECSKTLTRVYLYSKQRIKSLVPLNVPASLFTFDNCRKLIEKIPCYLTAKVYVEIIL